MIKVSVQQTKISHSTAARMELPRQQGLANKCALVLLLRAPAPASLAVNAETPTQSSATAGLLPGNQATVQVLATSNAAWVPYPQKLTIPVSIG